MFWMQQESPVCWEPSSLDVPAEPQYEGEAGLWFVRAFSRGREWSRWGEEGAQDTELFSWVSIVAALLDVAAISPLTSSGASNPSCPSEPKAEERSIRVSSYSCQPSDKVAGDR